MKTITIVIHCNCGAPVAEVSSPFAASLVVEAKCGDCAFKADIAAADDDEETK